MSQGSVLKAVTFTYNGLLLYIVICMESCLIGTYTTYKYIHVLISYTKEHFQQKKCMCFVHLQSQRL